MKLPKVFIAPDQEAMQITKLLTEDCVQCLDCRLSILSDKGTNLMANMMQDMCKLIE